MDGLSAIGLASNVAQFLEYGIRIVRTTQEIATSKKGASAEVAALETIIVDVDITLKSIRDPGAIDEGQGRTDETLKRLVQECLDLCPHITRITEKLHLKKGESRVKQPLESLRLAALTLCKKSEMDQLSERLSNLRAHVSAHLIVLIEQQQRELQRTLNRFLSTTEYYQEEFAANWQLSFKYLERISKKLDSIAVNRVALGDNKTYNKFDDVELEETRGFMNYRQNTADFYNKELGSLEGKKKEAILETLRFGHFVDRESAISEAHRRTFEWMLARNTSRDFVEWLQNQNGTFWISGKAGAGKSTLMRFIAEHPTTRKALADWANGRVVIAKHFFWRPGTPLQRSQEGLFRSLLLQVLKAQPNLIPSVCSERWLAPFSDVLLPWSRSQLIKAMGDLKAVLKNANISPQTEFKLCIFVDGLDEFDGDHFELIKILSDFTEPARVKMCASSRPWLGFLDAYGSSPWKIQIQDLTRQDMLIFVRDHLDEDGRFARLRAKDGDSATDIITNVVNRAEGVFLWVFLVVRSLLRGLRNEDDIRDLKRRMEAFPPDLETYFGRMLDEIEDVYRQTFLGTVHRADVHAGYYILLSGHRG